MLNNVFKHYELVERKLTNHHRTGSDAQRLCDSIGIKWDGFVLRALKVNRQMAEETAAYMKQEGITGIRYFTTTFWSKVKSIKDKSNVGT